MFYGVLKPNTYYNNQVDDYEPREYTIPSFKFGKETIFLEYCLLKYKVVEDTKKCKKIT